MLSSRRSTFLGFQPPAVGEEEVEAVAETIRSGWLTTGPKAAELEARAADLLEARHVLAVASGTAALHLALLAVGVGPGDEVITTPITWPATANVIVHAGATPVFVDVKDDDLNIDPELARAAVTRFLTAPAGELTAVEGVDEATRMEGVIRVRIYRAPGWRFGELRVGSDRAGAVQAIGDTRDEALERAAAAAERIRFVTADVDAKALA